MTSAHRLPATAPDDAFASAAHAIVATGRRLDRRGWAPATAGNYSIRLADGAIAITVSGAHKGRLSPDEVMRVSAQGHPLDGKKPSAETLLHCLIYELDATAGAVLHTHSVAGTVLSRVLHGDPALFLAGYELLKAFPAIDTHEAAIALPLVENSQDMAALAELLRSRVFFEPEPLPAFYIRGHGLYVWGPTIEAAENLVEACEFLIACEWEALKAGGGDS